MSDDAETEEADEPDGPFTINQIAYVTMLPFNVCFRPKMKWPTSVCLIGQTIILSMSSLNLTNLGANHSSG